MTDEQYDDEVRTLMLEACARGDAVEAHRWGKLLMKTEVVDPPHNYCSDFKLTFK
jgi:hypothetical protein